MVIPLAADTTPPSWTFNVPMPIEPTTRVPRFVQVEP
jgi:hypothetical protein